MGDGGFDTVAQLKLLAESPKIRMMLGVHGFRTIYTRDRTDRGQYRNDISGYGGGHSGICG